MYTRGERFTAASYKLATAAHHEDAVRALLLHVKYRPERIIIIIIIKLPN
jgi:hypothetical protein